MTRITNNHELIALVRQQLNKVSRAKVSRSSKVKNNKQPAEMTGLTALEKLAGAGEYSDEDMQRAVVQGLLAEEFGDGVVNDAQFQQVVDRVTKLIREDGDASTLMRQSIEQLGSGD